MTAVLTEPLTGVKLTAAQESYQLAQAAAADPAAFADIWTRYHHAVHKFIYFKVGNPQVAEDLTADTFLRALKRIDSFTWQGRDLGGWLATIARNLVADHFKSSRYRREALVADIPEAESGGTVREVRLTERGDHTQYRVVAHLNKDESPEGDPEGAVCDHLRNVDLIGAFRYLTDEQQDVLRCRFLRGLSVAETAAEMGLNVGAVKAVQWRATISLRRALPEGFQR